MTMKPPRTSSALRWIAIAGVVACAAWVSYRLIEAGWSPRRYDGYRFRNTEPVDWTYPGDEITRWVALFAAETLVMVLWLWLAKRSPAMACLLLALLCLGIGLLTGMMAMHAPMPFVSHAVLLFFDGVWLVVMAVVGALAALARRRPPADAAAG
jgi:hypothetical protein